MRCTSRHMARNRIRRIACYSCLAALLTAACAHRSAPPWIRRWDEKSSVFRWRSGSVKLPSGFTHQADTSDTIEGHFTSTNTRLVIRYDIGWLAGAWAKEQDAFSFNERMVQGARVWTARRRRPDGKGGTTTLVAVTFPDSACANFYLESTSIKDAAIIDVIAQSFRPEGRIAPGCKDATRPSPPSRSSTNARSPAP